MVLQSDSLALSTWLVAPTSISALAASFRPEIEVLGRRTRVLAEQTAAVDPQRLGDAAGRLTHEEMRNVDAALRLVLGLTRYAPKKAKQVITRKGASNGSTRSAVPLSKPLSANLYRG